MFELNKFFKYFSLFFIGIFISISSYSATITATASGDWNVGATWVGGIAPTNADDVVIPTGITVTIPLTYNSGDLVQNTFKTISISGTLDVKHDALLNEWVGPPNDVITVKNGGTFTITNNLSYQTNRTDIIVEQGATLTIGGTVTDNNNGAITFINSGNVDVVGNITSQSIIIINNSTGNIIAHAIFSTLKDLTNSGYIEVTGNLVTNSMVLTNNATGVIVVHSNIPGAGGTTTIYNYGIITADNNLTMNNIWLYNKNTGKILVYGDLEMQGSGRYENEGFVQCDNFTLPNLTSFHNYGTTVVLENFNVTWTGCPCNDGNWYLNTYSLANPTAASCVATVNCTTYWGGMPIITPGRRLWLNASFIGYGLGNDGEKINKWFDLANTFGFKMAQPTLPNQPTLKNNSTDNVNFNPVLSFSGADVNMDLDANTLFAPNADGGLAMFTIVIPNSGGAADQMVFDYGLYPTDGYGMMYSDQNMRAYTASTPGGIENNVIAHTRGTKPTLFSQTTTWSGNQILYVNGVSTQTQAVTLTKLDGTEISESNPYVAGVSGPYTLGGSSANPTTYDFDGKMAEVIVYANNISDATRKSTESFLALKYGITLNHEYTDYYGNTVYPNDATYKNAIIGIAREDLNLLRQRQSKSLDTGNELTVCTGTVTTYDQRTVSTLIVDDNSYFVSGHNGNTIASGNRIYKSKTSNFNQQVTLEFTIAALSAPYPDLLVDDNDAFSSPITISATSYTGDKLTYVHTFTNNSTEYFKLLAPVPVTQNPGVGINTESIHNSAELHIVSTNKGVLLPALANSAAIVAAPTEGLIFYNTTHKRFMYYDGTVWKFVGEPLKQDNATLTGSTGSYPGEMRYDTTNKVIYMWNGTIWVQLKNN